MICNPANTASHTQMYACILQNAFPPPPVITNTGKTKDGAHAG